MAAIRAKTEDVVVRDEVSAKVERDLVQKAKVIAAHRDCSVGRVLSDALRPSLDAQYRQVVTRAAQSAS